MTERDCRCRFWSMGDCFWDWYRPPPDTLDSFETCWVYGNRAGLLCFGGTLSKAKRSQKLLGLNFSLWSHLQRPQYDEPQIKTMKYSISQNLLLGDRMNERSFDELGLSRLLVFWLVICASCTSGKAVDRWLQLRVLHPPSPQQVPIVSRECDVSLWSVCLAAVLCFVQQVRGGCSHNADDALGRQQQPGPLKTYNYRDILNEIQPQVGHDRFFQSDWKSSFLGGNKVVLECIIMIHRRVCCYLLELEFFTKNPGIVVESQSRTG